MDRRTESPVYSRQWSEGSSTGSTSPVASPAHPRSRRPPPAVRMNTIKRTQNVAAKDAARRLAQVIASSNPPPDDEDDDEDDDLGFQFGPPPPPSSALSSNSKSNANIPTISLSKPSPALGQNLMDHDPTIRSTSAGRSLMSVRTNTETAALPSRPSMKTPISVPGVEPPRLREQRFVPFKGRNNSMDAGNQQEASALRDELDILEEENEIILDKLRHAEDKCEEAEARARELEKQVASLGEGVSLEARLLSRKEATLRKREVVLEAAKQSKNGRDEKIVVLRAELENFKDDVASTIEQLREARSEANALRTMTQRMLLSHEEMEEVVLKRCWLARYWGLAVHYGICADIASSKYEYWSSLAPLPFEVVISAGQKAREESWNGEDGSDKSNNVRDLSDLTKEGNIESMLSIEMSLRELASLKVEDAVVLAMAQKRRSNMVRQSSGISQEESEDVLFKEAWLTYFWRRAKVHNVEEDIAEERLQLWISRSGQSPTSHDAVDVERGLMELRKLGIEQLLWETSRKEIDVSSVSNTKLAAESKTSVEG